jgi:hypothetical protein
MNRCELLQFFTVTQQNNVYVGVGSLKCVMMDSIISTVKSSGFNRLYWRLQRQKTCRWSWYPVHQTI